MQLRDHLPVESLAAMTIEQSSAASENQILNGQAETASTGTEQEREGLSKLSEKIPSSTSSGQRQLSTTSNEYQGGSGRSRRTGNKSSRGRDSRRTGTVVQVREKPTAGSVSSRRSAATQRPIRSETQHAAGYHLRGATVARTIQTSDRRMRSGDSATERLSSSNTVTLTVVTGFISFNSTLV